LFLQYNHVLKYPLLAPVDILPLLKVCRSNSDRFLIIGKKLLSDTKPWKFLLLLIFSANWGNSVVVICISRSRNHFLTYREKNCRRGRLRPRHDNLEDVQGVHNKSLNSFILAFFLDEQLKSYSFINLSSEDLKILDQIPPLLEISTITIFVEIMQKSEPNLPPPIKFGVVAVPPAPSPQNKYIL
jgi:hypothetical protein